MSEQRAPYELSLAPAQTTGLPHLPYLVRLGRYCVVQVAHEDEGEDTHDLPPGLLLLDTSVPPKEVARLDAEETYRLLQTLHSWFPPPSNERASDVS